MWDPYRAHKGPINGLFGSHQLFISMLTGMDVDTGRKRDWEEEEEGGKEVMEGT